MDARLFNVPGSHPSLAARLMLQRKGIDYRRIDLVPAMHKLILPLLRFEGTTVPALEIDGRKLQGTREISRALDELRPAPPLFPADPSQRAAVEDAERWGDDELQSVPRRLVWAGFGRDSSSSASFLEGARLGVPIALAARTVAPIVIAEKLINDVDDEQTERDLAELPGLLDHADALIANGVIGGSEPNAADFQILTSVRLLDLMDDLRPALDGRASLGAARRLVPEYPGHLPAVFPDEWLGAVRAAGSSAKPAPAPA
ncbi:MAG: glutathione S-transferase N-terminal domain-containing protein [Thermoleophilaceae bacterium]